MDQPELPTSEENLPSPPPLTFRYAPACFSFHPQQDVVAVGLVTGTIECYKYAVGSNELLWSCRSRKRSVRAIEFSIDGKNLYCAMKDKSISIIDFQSGTILRVQEETHEVPLQVLRVLNSNTIATGDENGTLKLWDVEKLTCIQEWSEHHDYISDLLYVPHKKHLICSSADGFITHYDLNPKKMKLIAKSQQQDDELLSLCLMKNNKKLIVGSGEGVLNIFSWGQWLDSTDRFPGHPESVDSLLKIDEDTIATGSCDGLIRVCSILPNKLIGVLGDHGEFPIEQVSASWDKRWVGSISHDLTLKFWNAADLFGVSDERSEKEEGEKEVEEQVENFFEESTAAKSAVKRSASELEDDEDDEREKEEEENSDDEDENSDEKKKRKKRRQKLKRGLGDKKQVVRRAFFSGLF